MLSANPVLALLLFLHVFGAIVAFGPTYAFMFLGPMSGREPQHANFAIRFQHLISSRVILPLAFPAVVAGSIFTFALTLGDYITPRIVSNHQFIGNVIYNNILGENLPFAAALALVPIVVMVGYLLVARKLGAFEHI